MKFKEYINEKIDKSKIDNELKIIIKQINFPNLLNPNLNLNPNLPSLSMKSR